MGSATSSVWNFYTPSTDFFSRKNQLLRRETGFSSLGDIPDGNMWPIVTDRDFFSALLHYCIQLFA